MRNFVYMKYDENGAIRVMYKQSTEEGESVEELDASAIVDRPIEQWNTPFVHGNVRWYGLDEEIRAAAGFESYSIIFYAEDEVVRKLRRVLSGKGIFIFGAQNLVEIAYDRSRMHTQVTINGRTIDTSVITGYPIQMVVNPIPSLDWDGLFEEIQDFMGNAPFSAVFSGAQEDMSALIQCCPDNLNLTYKEPATVSGKMGTLLGDTVSSIKNVSRSILLDSGAGQVNDAQMDGKINEDVPFELQKVAPSQDKSETKAQNEQSSAAPAAAPASSDAVLNDRHPALIRNMHCPYCKHDDAFVVSTVIEQSSKIRLLNFGLKYLLCFFFTFGFYAIICGLPIIEKNRTYTQIIYGFCPRCGKSYSAAAPKSMIRKEKESRQLRRNLDRKVIAGVCAGIADYTDLPAWWIRLVFVFLTLVLIGYIVFSILIGAGVFLSTLHR